jgi:hypothetical protein
LDANHMKAWQAATAMMPKPQMLKYHNAFFKEYLELLLFHQQYGSIKVPKAIIKSLHEWLHNQHTLIGGYRNKKAGNKFWENKEDRYINILNALGADYVARS